MPSEPAPGAAADRDPGDPTARTHPSRRHHPVPGPVDGRGPDRGRRPAPHVADGDRAGRPGSGWEPAPGATDRHDFAVLAVTGDLGGVDWARTVGLRRATGSPDLLLDGLPAVLAGAVLEALGERVLRGWRPVPGADTRVGPLRVRFVALDEPVEDRGPGPRPGRSPAAGHPAGPGRGEVPRDGTVLRVLWADEHGRFDGPAAAPTDGRRRRGPDGGEPGRAA